MPKLRFISISLICFASLAVSVFVVRGTWTQAATVDEIKDKISNTNQTLEQLNKEINDLRQELDKTSTQAQTLQTTVNSLDLNSKKLGKDLQVTSTKVEATNLTIEQLSLNISDKEWKIISNRQALSETLKQVNQSDSTSLLETLLRYPTISAFSTEIQTISQFQTNVRDQLFALQNLKVGLEKNKQDTEKQKQALIDLKNQLADQKTVIEINKNEKAKILNETKSKESNYKKVITDKEAKKKAFEAELKTYESQLKIAIDPKSIPNAGSGVLAWPLDEHVVTQAFGHTDFSKTVTVYNGNGHNGIDLRASIGTPVKSAADGVIVGTGDTDTTCPGASYGRWILIKHTNGLSTLYGHLSVIKVNPGQSVGRGEVIGYSGFTGYATGPHLHFTVYASQGVEIVQRPSASCDGRIYTMPVADLKAYLNPLSYL
jgi:murein DD-endopeptidase MepM/ murein hydrolase activator NlpD